MNQNNLFNFKNLFDSKIIEEYVYYDGPLVYLSKNYETNTYYFGFCIARSADMFVGMTEEEIKIAKNLSTSLVDYLLTFDRERFFMQSWKHKREMIMCLSKKVGDNYIKKSLNEELSGQEYLTYDTEEY